MKNFNGNLFKKILLSIGVGLTLVASAVAMAVFSQPTSSSVLNQPVSANTTVDAGTAGESATDTVDPDTITDDETSIGDASANVDGTFSVSAVRGKVGSFTIRVARPTEWTNSMFSSDDVPFLAVGIRSSSQTSTYTYYYYKLNWQTSGAQQTIYTHSTCRTHAGTGNGTYGESSSGVSIAEDIRQYILENVLYTNGNITNYRSFTIRIFTWISGFPSATEMPYTAVEAKISFSFAESERHIYANSKYFNGNDDDSNAYISFGGAYEDDEPTDGWWIYPDGSSILTNAGYEWRKTSRDSAITLQPKTTFNSNTIANDWLGEAPKCADYEEKKIKFAGWFEKSSSDSETSVLYANPSYYQAGELNPFDDCVGEGEAVPYDITGILYAAWTRLNQVDLYSVGGTGGTTSIYYYYGMLAYYSTSSCLYEIDEIIIPTSASAIFKGYYDAGGTQFIDEDGWILNELCGEPGFSAGDTITSTTITLYAEWESNGSVITITLDKNGGTGGTSGPIYYKYGTNAYYTNSSCTTQITTITAPTKTGYTFGGYVGDGTHGGNADERFIFAAGSFATELCSDIYENATLTAKWNPNTIKITLDKNGGTGGTSGPIYYKYGTNKYYTNSSCTTQITTITAPTKTGYTFGGYLGDGTHGGNADERFIFAAGSFATDLCSDIYENATLTAKWDPSTITITLNANGGTLGTSYIYYKYGTSTYYSNSGCTTTITSITIPTKSGSTFSGFYTTSTGGSYYVFPSGAIRSGLATAITSNTTLYAHWGSPEVTMEFVVGSTLDYVGAYTINFEWEGGVGSKTYYINTFFQTSSSGYTLAKSEALSIVYTGTSYTFSPTTAMRGCLSRGGLQRGSCNCYYSTTNFI